MAIVETMAMLRVKDADGNEYILNPITSIEAVQGLSEELQNIKTSSGRNYTATIGTNWTAAGDMYVQNIAVTGILQTDCPIVDLILPLDDSDIAFEQMIQWDQIHSIKTYDGHISVYAFTKTEMEMKIQLGC